VGVDLIGRVDGKDASPSPSRAQPSRRLDLDRHAQGAGQVSTALPADRLLDHVLALAHGNVALAGHASSWIDVLSPRPGHQYDQAPLPSPR
jgi:hypothetical protein